MIRVGVLSGRKTKQKKKILSRESKNILEKQQKTINF